MSLDHDFDLFTIGAGSGGVRASRIAAGHGAKVAVAEERQLGGTCVNVGCVPKKLFVYASHFREDVEDAAGYGWTVPEASLSWATLRKNKDVEIARLNGVYGRLLDEAGVTRIEGRARVVDAHTVAVGETTYTARVILVAVGSWPSVPAIPGAELGITSNEFFHLEQLPASVVVVGGGYIGAELSTIFHGLGVEVTLVHRGELLLRGFDDDLRRAVGENMAKKGIDLRLDCSVSCIERAGGELAVSFTDGTAHPVGAVLFATGRVPCTADLGLREAGVRLDEVGAVVVDEHQQSSVPSIYALGDVTNRIMLTPMAIAEGHAFADSVFGGRPRVVAHRGVPTAVFTQPPVATVGLTEAEARGKFGQIDVYRASFRPLRHTLSGRDERAMMKLVVDRESDRVVGCHVVSPHAAEIVQGVAIALECGATKAQFDATLGIHPTLAEELVTMRTKVGG